jgi:arabinan endo-1,5-alpha-L-arabinosidase
MDVRRRSSDATFTNPVDGVVLGDPFVLRHRGRFYLYGTNDGPDLPDGRKIPVFRSDDLLHWELLGGALEPSEPTFDHWAPEVLAWNGRFFMVVSFGDVDRRGHALWVAVADRPEGPFRLANRLSDPSERFSIDGSWLLDDDGSLYLFRCLDFVAEDDPPSGTGIVVQPMRDPFAPAGAPATVLRAHSPWQLFLADRVMPLYGGRTFAEWTTVEGPAPVRRAGRYFCGYSGGNYSGAYGTGEVTADRPRGPYTDPRGRAGPLFGTVPGLVEGPGHFSVVRPDLVHDWIVLHGRRPGEAGRRVWLCPARWDRDGVAIGALTDRPQPAPPLPTFQDRFEGANGALPAGWRAEGGRWALSGDGRALSDDAGAGMAYLWLETVRPASEWAAEADFRLPRPDGRAAGLAVGAGSEVLRVLVDAEEVSCSAVEGPPSGGRPDVPTRSRPVPTLGDERFESSAWHNLALRASGGRLEIRLDGVLLFEGVPAPVGATTVGLLAKESAEFGSFAVTNAASDE